MTTSSVTVITRTKNRTLLLERAIKSVLAQTREDWTHVIVNDGGDFRKPGVCLEIKPRRISTSSTCS